MKTTFRSGYCGNYRLSDAGKTVSVTGWVQRNRDLGQLMFIDLRDRTGILQLAFDETTPRAAFEAASACRGEFVVGATGVIRERSSKNPDLPTGEIELAVQEFRVFSAAQVPPFEINDDVSVNEALADKNMSIVLLNPEFFPKDELEALRAMKAEQESKE